MENPSKTQCIAPPQQLINFHNVVGGEISEDYGLFKLVFNSDFGCGKITCAQLSRGISVLDIEVLLTKDLRFRLGTPDAHLFHFIYCLEGTAHFKSNHDDKYQKIEELKSAYYHVIIIQKTK
ncbi:hypothetical protein N7U66_06710 [Lacinutrix neustonica]|uniref:Uncharacterized protein n=1 Tax=Lacinutrix neustonica TaxID=2980107 RepID=A0A9E8SEY7_9FLAO|nr:hypothetical protein [Lacinutrix neustonica]WAC03257.1 hypothetical protein N7U66_06710 [Lacinutrix neustonica]